MKGEIGRETSMMLPLSMISGRFVLQRVLQESKVSKLIPIKLCGPTYTLANLFLPLRIQFEDCYLGG